MRIRNNRLYGDDNRAVPFVQASGIGGNVSPEYLIMHYTAGGAGSGTVRQFAANGARVSAHLVISRDGSITQMVKFNRKGWHAGISRWKNRTGLNAYSIGIELANWGLLENSGDGHRSWSGRSIPSGLVTEDAHQHSPTVQRHWEIFPEEQIEAAVGAAAAICRQYNIPASNILGHDDISPGRKIDPGPAFKMASFKAKVFGRDDDDTDLFATEFFVQSPTGLNLRDGAMLAAPVIKNMPDGTRVRVHLGESKGHWWMVTALDANGNDDVTGFAHSNWLVAV